MCFQEYIAYQCGHSSFAVVRTCPMTTAGHNFPVCSRPPSKQNFAETMCAPCERQLHSRWVLIREWEHRWMHERGACGCDVSFPGLLNTPRVIGGEAASDTSSSAATPASTSAEEVEVPATAMSTVAVASSASDGQPEGSKTAAEKATTSASASDGRVPAIFSEAVNSSGEHHVAVRLPGLYAAEWRDDHRALHEAGKCTCKVDFAPFQPQIQHQELTVAELDKVREWELEADKVVVGKNDAKDINGQIGNDTGRIAEIEKLFGKFTLGDETPTVNLPRASDAPVAGNEVVIANGSGRQGHNPGGYAIPSHQSQQNFPQMQPAAVYGPPSFPPAQNPYTAYQPVAINPAQIPTYPFSHGFLGYYNPNSTYGPYNPAYPAYATFATYTNTMPQGAYHWHGPAQRNPNTPWCAQGPGPYRTPGLVFSTPPTVVGGNPSQVQSSQEQATQHRGRQQQREQQDSSIAQPKPTPLPLIGLPIGAGPEGTSHMPSWKQCRLRSASVDMASDRESESEENKGEDGDDNSSIMPLAPPRCNSAPT